MATARFTSETAGQPKTKRGRGAPFFLGRSRPDAGDKGGGLRAAAPLFRHDRRPGIGAPGKRARFGRGVGRDAASGCSAGNQLRGIRAGMGSGRARVTGITCAAQSLHALAGNVRDCHPGDVPAVHSGAADWRSRLAGPCCCSGARSRAMFAGPVRGYCAADRSGCRLDTLRRGIFGSWCRFAACPGGRCGFGPHSAQVLFGAVQDALRPGPLRLAPSGRHPTCRPAATARIGPFPGGPSAPPATPTGKAPPMGGRGRNPCLRGARGWCFACGQETSLQGRQTRGNR